jgi:cytochrome c oxidase subunit II
VPPPISLSRVLTWWLLDPLALAMVVAAAVLYFGGVRRLAAKGRRWGAGRSTLFAAGLLVLLFASSSGLARYEEVLFSAHVGQHLLLGMLAPLLLALGAPVTLALQASHRSTQVFLVKVLHSAPVKVLSQPVVVLVLFSGSLLMLYFSDLFELSLRNGVVHQWMHLHFLVAGLLFFWVVVGVDPAPGRPPAWARAMMLLLVVPVHAILGIALVTGDAVIAREWYEALGRTWGASPLDDQRTGGALMWTVGELMTIAVGGVLVAQWVRSERRRAIRIDRRLAAAAVGTALVASSCASDILPEGVTDTSSTTADLWNLFVVVAAIVGAIVWGAIVWVVIRYRRKSDEVPDQRQYMGPLEISCVVIPLIIVGGLWFAGWQAQAEIIELSDNPDVDIEVVGFQWQWQFNYNESPLTDHEFRVSGAPGEIPELVVPVGSTVQFDLVSNDVIHSFWVPEFLEKRDLIPEIDNRIEVVVDREGTWAGRCAEFCGFNHWQMYFSVKAVSESDYADWVAQQ